MEIGEPPYLITPADLGHVPGFNPSIIDEEIRPLIKKLNQVDGIETLFCCAGYGRDDKGRKHARRDLAHAYVYLRYTKMTPVILDLHWKLLQIVDQVSVTEIGYTFRPWRAFLHDGEYIPGELPLYKLNLRNKRRLINDWRYYRDRKAYVKKKWALFEKAVDEALACGSFTPTGRLKSTSSSSTAPALGSSGHEPTGGLYFARRAAAARASKK